MASPNPTPPSPDSTTPLHLLPHSKRPSHGSLLLSILFIISFNIGIILTNLVQIIFYPLSLIPATKPTWERVLDRTKGSFGQLCVFITQWFAPTTYVITGGEGMGSDLSSWIQYNSLGQATSISLPEKSVFVANHQTLCDWIYIWTFFYLSHHSSSVIITLKSSLRRIPIIGWACQMYNFIFLSRKWENDKKPFGRQLEKIAERTKGRHGEDKLALLIFPEGTLVTGNTKPVSEKYAAKIGVKPYSHLLLPRTTGLYFTLSTLSPSLPSLTLMDLTIGYPGPDASKEEWPEDYYDLSIWMKYAPPPSIHFHVRQWKVSEIPGIGDGKEGQNEEEKRERFDEWLRDRWSEKDVLMEKFVKTGSFVDSKEKQKEKEEEAHWPVRLRKPLEHLEAFSYFLPIFILYFTLPWVWKILFTVGGIGWSLVKGGVKEEKSCGCGKMGGKGSGEL